jgi:hypothetical protein
VLVVTIAVVWTRSGRLWAIATGVGGVIGIATWLVSSLRALMHATALGSITLH